MLMLNLSYDELTLIKRRLLSILFAFVPISTNDWLRPKKHTILPLLKAYCSYMDESKLNSCHSFIVKNDMSKPFEWFLGKERWYSTFALDLYCSGSKNRSVREVFLYARRIVHPTPSPQSVTVFLEILGPKIVPYSYTDIFILRKKTNLLRIECATDW